MGIPFQYSAGRTEALAGDLRAVQKQCQKLLSMANNLLELSTGASQTSPHLIRPLGAPDVISTSGLHLQEDILHCIWFCPLSRQVWEWAQGVLQLASPVATPLLRTATRAHLRGIQAAEPTSDS